MKKLIMFVFITSLIYGCVYNNKNQSVSLQNDEDSYGDSLVCKYKVEELTKKPTVVFLGFKNNTPYVMYDSEDKKQRDKIVMALNERFISILKANGFDVISRIDSPIIFKELIFQKKYAEKNDAYIPEIGKVKASKYMLLGSIDSIKLEYKDNKIRKEIAKQAGIPFLLTEFIAEKLEKRYVEVFLSFKILDIETGETVIHKSVKQKIKEKFDINNLPQKYEVIKKASFKALNKLSREYFKINPLRAKILKIEKENGKLTVYINKGFNDGISIGDKFKILKPKKVYFEEENIEECVFKDTNKKVKIIKTFKNFSIGEANNFDIMKNSILEKVY